MGLQLAGHAIEAISVGGIETCIQLPGWKLCFDIGRCPPDAVRRERVLLTHAHIDHAGGLATHAAMRDLLGMSPPTWYVPRANAPDIEALLAVWRRLDHAELRANVVPCDPGDRLELARDRVAIPFRVPHRVLSQGYALVERRTRLRPEFASASREELRLLRARGETLGAAEDVVEVAFCGDTRPEVLDREPLVHAARLLILECTFLDDRVPPALAHAKGHVHLEDLVERADLLCNEAILLTHMSARYDDATILRRLDARLPPDLRARVTPLLRGPRDDS
jgi:ribonuclease Z